MSATFTASPTTTFTGPSATGSGNITASFTGGGPCTYVASRFIPVSGDPASPPAGSAPASISFPHGLFDFSLGGCSQGSSITMTITCPAPLDPRTSYWKYGPRPPAGTVDARPPMLSEWMLVLMALLILGAGMEGLRRRAR